MSEEQFNHTDQRFRDAASNMEHDFDESAWKRMEKLLDQEERRKRPFLWWWTSLGLLLLLAGGIWLATSHFKAEPVLSTGTEQPQKNLPEGTQPSLTTTSSAKNQSSQLQQDVGPPGADLSASQPATKVEKNIHHHQNTPIGKEFTQSNHQETPTHPAGSVVQNEKRESPQPPVTVSRTAVRKNKKTAPATHHQRTKQQWVVDEEGSSAVNETIKDKNGNSIVVSNVPQTNEKVSNHPVKQDAAVQTSIVTSQQAEPAESEKILNQPQNQDESGKKVDSAKLAVAQPSTTPDKTISQPQNPKKNARGWYFMAGIGADVSSTRLFSFTHNPVAARYGLGIGYRLNKKWAVQTGFMATAKKYIAHPGDYKLSPDPYWNQVSLLYIDASCLVYEIPLQLRYDFLKLKSSSLFATIGLSSFIMKKETYDYHIENNNYYYDREYSYTGNKHPLSVVSISAGWMRPWGKQTAWQLEPYVQIPLGGVGEGKVKLYSFGIQGSFLLQPAKKKPVLK